MTSRPHTDREYEGQLVRLRELILLMGAEVEAMIVASVRALVERDSEIARGVLDNDSRIDQMEIQIDGAGIHVLALRQPVASDLRFITTVLKIVRDLERIGDLAVNIAERVLELNEEAPPKTFVDIPRMADAAQGMLRDALDSLVRCDADLAKDIVERDDLVDALYDQYLRVLLTYMMESPANIYQATRIQSVAKYLERIADHATNIAEMVVFNVQGTDIRHTGGANPAVP